MTSPSHGEDLVFESRRAHIRLRLVCGGLFFKKLKDESFLKNVFAPPEEILQITPIIHAIRHSFRIPIAPGITFDRFVYSYVIYGDTIVLIDTGVAGSENQIFEDIRSTGRNPSEIALIILTHSHRTISERRGQFNRQPGAV